jgi:hypothetical protein
MPDSPQTGIAWPPNVVVARSAITRLEQFVRLVRLARWLSQEWGQSIEIVAKETGRTWMTIHE